MARRARTPLRSTLAPGVTALVTLLASAAASERGGAESRRIADLAPPPGGEGPIGHAVLEPGRRRGEFRLRLVLSNDLPGAHRTWRLRAPTGGTVHPLAPLRVNARGNAVAVVTLPGTLAAAPRLLIEVHDAGTILASGLLVG
jgi:hypothetical protein